MLLVPLYHCSQVVLSGVPAVAVLKVFVPRNVRLQNHKNQERWICKNSRSAFNPNCERDQLAPEPRPTVLIQYPHHTMPSSPLPLIFVTGNAGKLREVHQILSSSSSSSRSIALTSRDLDLPEVQGTTQEVALAKVIAAAKEIGGACITEDTALGFEALGGLPGPYIKSFMKELGHEGMFHLFLSSRALVLCEKLTLIMDGR